MPHFKTRLVLIILLVFVTTHLYVIYTTRRDGIAELLPPFFRALGDCGLPRAAPGAVPRVVVLSSSPDPQYAFYVPLTALLWALVADYTPLLLLTGRDSWLSTPHAQAVLAALEEWNLHKHVFMFEDGSATSTQAIRLFASMLPGYSSSTYMVTSDADIWPVNGSYFDVSPQQRRELTVWDADCPVECPEHTHPATGLVFRELMMSHIGATTELWREIMDLPLLESGDSGAGLTTCEIDDGMGIDVRGKLRSHLRVGTKNSIVFPKLGPANTTFHSDQLLAGIHVKQWGKPYRKISRDTTRDRLDLKIMNPAARHLKKDHNGSPILDDIIDIHLPRIGFGPEWERSLRPILKQVLDPAIVELVDTYVDDFRFFVQQPGG